VIKRPGQPARPLTTPGDSGIGITEAKDN